MAGLSACGGDDDGDGGSDEKVSIAFFNQANTTFTKEMENGVREAAEKAGDVSVRVFSANFDPQAQLRQCQDAIVANTYNAFVIYAAAEGTLRSCINRAVDKDIMISGTGTRLGTPELPAKGIVTEYTESADSQGEASYKALQGACKAANADPCQVGWLLAQRSNPFSAGHLAGTQKLLRDDPSIKIVAQGETGFDNPDAGRRGALDMLQAHPGIDVISTDDDGAAMGVEQGVKARGADVQIIGFGSSKRGYDATKEGRWYGTLVNTPFTMGRQSAEDVIGAVRGTVEKRDQYLSLWSLSPIGSLLTKENADEFTPEWP